MNMSLEFMSQVTIISKENEMTLTTNSTLFEALPLIEKEQLFKLCVEYVSTPIEDREVKLSEVEEHVLENIEDVSYIARDSSGGLFLFYKRPTKNSYEWLVEYDPSDSIEIKDDLFSFVRWEDDEPTKISDLLEVE